MQIITQGLVLRKVAYSGSSAIVTIYTKRYGAMAFMVRGASGKRSQGPGRKSSAASALQPLAQVEVAFSYRENKQVQIADQLSLGDKSSFHTHHPAYAPVALFIAEVLFRSLREESADPDLYEFIEAALEYFAESRFNPNFHIIFMMKLTRFFGFPPSGEPCESTPYFDLQNGEFTHSPSVTLHTMDPDLSLAFYQLSKAEFDSEIRVGNQLRRAVLEKLVEYYQLHLEGMGDVKSLQVLTEVFSN
jgi:DNA repair protein RecO (recombination protein O)